MMEALNYQGIWIYQKERKDQNTLKDFLQFLRSNSPQKNIQFSYVEAQNSLIKDLSLWENLKLEVGGSSWREVAHTLRPEWAVLMNVIRDPNILAQNSQHWERFMIGLLKGLMSETPHLIIDMNEDHLPSFLVSNVKKVLSATQSTKQIYLASANPELWIECAHTKIIRNNYLFETQNLVPSELRRLKIA